MSGHICMVCYLDSSDHEQRCNECGDTHWPALCCPGCPCGSFEEAHPDYKPAADAAAEKRRDEMSDETTEALKAAQQCMRDALEVYERGVSGVVMDEAMRSMKHDGLKKVNAVLKTAAPAPAREGVTEVEPVCANCGKGYGKHHRVFKYCNMGYFESGQTVTMWKEQEPPQ